MIKQSLVIQIDALLPQTQCGLCGHGGCMPYAKAMAEEGEAINRCPPGGTRVLNKLAALLNQDPIPLRDPAKPALVAYIREEECIGCMKCITACPVDAIVGAGKLMHTVIADVCTGCELCVAPCPVDCIDMLLVDDAVNDDEFYEHAAQAREAFYRRNARLEKQKLEKHQNDIQLTQEDKDAIARKTFIAEAVARARAKKI